MKVCWKHEAHNPQHIEHRWVEQSLLGPKPIHHRIRDKTWNWEPKVNQCQVIISEVMKSHLCQYLWNNTLTWWECSEEDKEPTTKFHHFFIVSYLNVSILLFKRPLLLLLPFSSLLKLLLLFDSLGLLLLYFSTNPATLLWLHYY